MPVTYSVITDNLTVDDAKAAFGDVEVLSVVISGFVINTDAEGFFFATLTLNKKKYIYNPPEGKHEHYLSLLFQADPKDIRGAFPMQSHKIMVEILKSFGV